MCKEIKLRTNYLPTRHLSTIYFGGGTPSLLSGNDIGKLLDSAARWFSIDPSAEITFEANPDDLTPDYIATLRSTGINRLSIGIQSFHDPLLRTINRRHTARQALDSIATAQQTGFDNISIDLIYGLPGQDMLTWQSDLHTALWSGIQHLSAYGLSYEQGTILYTRMKRGEIQPADDETYNRMYDLLTEQAATNGFERYEVSNFSLPGKRSRHNSSYWNETPYIGIGPGAHSYNRTTRQWNIDSLEQYIKSIGQNHIPCEQETLSLTDHYNEYIMLSLRTTEGINTDYLLEEYGTTLYKYCIQQARPHLAHSLLYQSSNRLAATQQGIYLLNRITENLMTE